MTINLIFAWTWILLGVLTGFALGTQFHRAEWLGGYASMKRRMPRLGHIALFGMAIINLLFYLTVKETAMGGPAIEAAAWGFLAGGVMMPLCCVLMAFWIHLRVLFVLPVVCLAVSSVLMLLGLMKR